MRFNFVKSTIFILLCLTFFSLGAPVYSSSLDDTLEEYQEKIREYEKKINELKGKEHTLSNEIAYLDNQIYYTELKIQETTAQIEKKSREIEALQDDIEDLALRIDRLGEVIDLQETIYLARVREKYKREEGLNGSFLMLFLQSDKFANTVSKLKYLRSIEKQDKLLLTQMNLSKSSFEGQKNILENKKDKVEMLRRDIGKQRGALQGYKVTLNEQRGAKGWLLAETKNKEENYQRMLAQIRAELASINSALASIIGKEGTPVEKGDVIALEGNTGCSTGPHLHFGVYKDGVAVNPRDYLGDELDWPISNPTVTQEYGENRDWYLRNFGIPGHNGMDMTGPSPYYGTPIKAAADGVAYISYDNNACYMTGTIGKGIVVDHGDGLVTIYWHVQ